MENLIAAEAIARKGKQHQYGVKIFDRDPERNLSELRDMLYYREYTTGPYSHIRIHDPKERDVARLAYYPHRIVQHAIMLQLENHFVSSLTVDTFSCIKGRGIHGFHRSMKRALSDVLETRYCLKIDIRKFYPSIDHDVLKAQLRRKFKDPDLLWLLDDIIDSAPGVPIGNYISQFLANFNMSPFDHWIKEVMRVKYYLRYCDDMVILAPNKPYLHQLLASINEYLSSNLKLSLKHNYQVFPVEDRGIYICGYVYYHGYTRMRKRIKQNFARAVRKGKNKQSLASYLGWARFCNSGNLVKKLLPDFKSAA